MMSQSVLLLVLMTSVPVSIANSKAFLSPTRSLEVRQQLDGILEQVLGGGHNVPGERLTRIEKFMTPLFNSLPKNRAGRVSSAVMRYAVQRYFGQQNGWILKGFESHAVTLNVSDVSAGAQLLQGKLPEYVRSALEEKFSTNGFALKDAVGMIGALEMLTFDEVLRGLQLAFKLNSLPLTGKLKHVSLIDVLTSYLLIEMLEGDAGDAQQHHSDKINIRNLYPHWDTTYEFMRDVVENDRHARKPLMNPFQEDEFSFVDASRIAQSLTEQFGPFSSHECHQIKDSLAALDVHGTGRVKLSDFYSSSQGGTWQFREASGYLRELGALDESSSKLGPQVIIPNYILGMSNCITSTQYYAVCCQSECNEVYQHLEDILPSSHDGAWSANHIAGAVEGIWDQNISTLLLGRLEQVSQIHNGKIPLHGRLLAQWLHYVFPQDCPYPHVAQTINPQTPAKWEEALGQDASTASEAEVEQFLQSKEARLDPSPDAGADMWNPEEVLLIASTPSDAVTDVRAFLRTCAIFGLIAGLVSLLLKELLPSVVSILGITRKTSEFKI